MLSWARGSTGPAQIPRSALPFHIPTWHQTVSAATEVRQIVWRERENTCRDRACVSPGISTRTEVCQAPELAQEPWQIPSLAGCSGPAVSTRATSQGSCRGVRKIPTQQLRSSGNAPNSSDGRWGQPSRFSLSWERFGIWWVNPGQE